MQPGRQTGFFLETDKEYLAKLNNKDNPNEKIFSGNSNYETSFTVNPYPNENKNLSIISVVGDTSVNSTLVKGQYIKTGARIDNLLAEDYTRITSEVYHPDGNVVDPKYAKAILITPDNKETILAELQKTDPTATLAEGDILFKMPEGAIMNDPEAEANGEYKPILNPNSIFNNSSFKGVQNLKARFFARPRTQAEFEALVKEANDQQKYISKYYTPTGAGTKAINHNGQEVLVDLQGIARYDHYNKVGEITVSFDDTRNYDQNWDEKKVKETDKMTGIHPGETKIMEIKAENEGLYPNEKTALEMNEARNDGRVTGTVDPEFIKKAEDEGWKIEITPGDLSKFKVTAPADAKAGDFIAIPMTYTYTNGSEDNHWFHFVVQESNNNRPEYSAKAGYQGDILENTPTLPSEKKDLEKNQPESYELKPGIIYKDDRGNIWSNVSIDSKTGKVTVVVPENADIVGGENLIIPVIANYTDTITGAKKTEEIKAQFIARPTHAAKGGNSVVEEIPFVTNVIYDENLDAGTVIETAGELGSKRTIYEWDFDSRRKNAEGTEVRPVAVKLTEIIIKEKKDAEIRIGIRPVETIIQTGFDTEIIFDDSLDAGEVSITKPGEEGLKKVTTVTDQKSGKISLKVAEEKKAINRVLKVGTKTEGMVVDTDEIPFDVKVEFDESMTLGGWKYKEVDGKKLSGNPGSITKTWNISNSIAGDPIVEKILPEDAVIIIGTKAPDKITSSTGYDIPFETEIIYNPEKPIGAVTVLQEGKAGRVEDGVETYYDPATNKLINNKTGKEIKARKRVVEVGTKPITCPIPKPEPDTSPLPTPNDKVPPSTTDNTPSDTVKDPETNTVVIPPTTSSELKSPEFTYTPIDPKENVYQIADLKVLDSSEKMKKALPQTGDVSSPLPLAGAAGALITALGLGGLIKSRKQNQE